MKSALELHLGKARELAKEAEIDRVNVITGIILLFIGRVDLPGGILTFGIAAFAAAAGERMANFRENCEKMAALRDQLIVEAQKLGCKINTPADCAPHIVNLSPCVGRSEVYIRVLSDRGIYVSGGSACSRGKKSHVLTAMRVSGKNADAALRVSLCPETSEEDIDAFLSALADAKKMF